MRTSARSRMPRTASTVRSPARQARRRQRSAPAGRRAHRPHRASAARRRGSRVRQAREIVARRNAACAGQVRDVVSGAIRMRRQADLSAHMVAQPTFDFRMRGVILPAQRIERRELGEIVEVRRPRPRQRAEKAGRALVVGNIVGLRQRYKRQLAPAGPKVPRKPVRDRNRRYEPAAAMPRGGGS